MWYQQETSPHLGSGCLAMLEQRCGFQVFLPPISRFLIWNIYLLTKLFDIVTIFFILDLPISIGRFTSNNHRQSTISDCTMSMSWLLKISDIVPLIVLILCDDWSSVICWWIRSPTTNDIDAFFGRGCCIRRNA